VFAIECRRWERNLKIQTTLPLALASLVFGCGGQLSLDEAGLLDAVAFVTGGQEEGAVPQGFETRWRRTVHGREIEYQSIGPNAGFGQANSASRQPPRAAWRKYHVTGKMRVQDGRDDRVFQGRERKLRRRDQ